MVRPVVTLSAAVLALLLGVAGLARGLSPQHTVSPGDTGGGIVVGGAYVREPANALNAAAYFTIFNTSGADDQLMSISSGAGADTGMHTEDNGTMVAVANLTVPAHSRVVFEPGKYHVMIDRLYGPLKPGSTVNFELQFRHAGQVLVTAPVVAIGSPAPTAVAPR